MKSAWIGGPATYEPNGLLTARHFLPVSCMGFTSVKVRKITRMPGFCLLLSRGKLRGDDFQRHLIENVSQGA
jgi:hypothetical protein